MNKTKIAKLLFKSKKIQALFESKDFSSSEINKMIAEQILLKESENNDLPEVDDDFIKSINTKIKNKNTDSALDFLFAYFEKGVYMGDDRLVDFINAILEANNNKRFRDDHYRDIKNEIKEYIGDFLEKTNVNYEDVGNHIREPEVKANKERPIIFKDGEVKNPTQQTNDQQTSPSNNKSKDKQKVTQAAKAIEASLDNDKIDPADVVQKLELDADEIKDAVNAVVDKAIKSGSKEKAEKKASKLKAALNTSKTDKPKEKFKSEIETLKDKVFSAATTEELQKLQKELEELSKSYGDKDPLLSSTTPYQISKEIEKRLKDPKLFGIEDLEKVDKEDVKQVQDYVMGKEESPGTPSKKEVKVAFSVDTLRDIAAKNTRVKERVKKVIQQVQAKPDKGPDTTDKSTTDVPDPNVVKDVENFIADGTGELDANVTITDVKTAVSKPEVKSAIKNDENAKDRAEKVVKATKEKEKNKKADVESKGWAREGKEAFRRFLDKNKDKDIEAILQKVLESPEEFKKEFKRTRDQDVAPKQEQLRILADKWLREKLEEIKEKENVEEKTEDVANLASTLNEFDKWLSSEAQYSSGTFNDEQVEAVASFLPSIDIPESFDEFQSQFLDPIEKQLPSALSKPKSVEKEGLKEQQYLEIFEDNIKESEILRSVNDRSLKIFYGWYISNKKSGTLEAISEGLRDVHALTKKYAEFRTFWSTLNGPKYVSKTVKEDVRKYFSNNTQEAEKVLSEIQRMFDEGIIEIPKGEEPEQKPQLQLTAAIEQALETEASAKQDADLSSFDKEELDEKWIQKLDIFFGKNPEKSSFMKQLLLKEQATMLFDVIKTLKEIEVGKLLVGKEGMEMASLTDLSPEDDQKLDSTENEEEVEAPSGADLEEQVINEIFKMFSNEESDEEIVLSDEGKRQMRTSLEAMVDLLKALKIDIREYEQYATKSSVDPRYDGSTLKIAMETKLKVVQRVIKNLVKAMHTEILRSEIDDENERDGLLNSQYDDEYSEYDDEYDDEYSEYDDEYDDEYSEYDEEDTFQESLNPINEEDEGERKLKIQEVRRVYDKMREMYLYGLRTSLERNNVPKSKRGAKEMRDYILSEKEFLSYFPTAMVVGGKVMTLGQAYESMTASIQKFVDTVRDIVTITKTQRVEAESLELAVKNLLELSRDIQSIFGVPSALAQEIMDKYVEELNEDPDNQPLSFDEEGGDEDTLEKVPKDALDTLKKYLKTSFNKISNKFKKLLANYIGSENVTEEQIEEMLKNLDENIQWIDTLSEEEVEALEDFMLALSDNAESILSESNRDAIVGTFKDALSINDKERIIKSDISSVIVAALEKISEQQQSIILRLMEDGVAGFSAYVYEYFVFLKELGEDGAKEYIKSQSAKEKANNTQTPSTHGVSRETLENDFDYDDYLLGWDFYAGDENLNEFSEALFEEVKRATISGLYHLVSAIKREK